MHTLFYLPSGFRVAYAAHFSEHFSNHQMRDRSPHRELRYLLVSNTSMSYLWYEGSLAFEKAHKAFFHSGVYCDKWNSSTLRNCLLLRPACTFYITLICTCLPCAVVKNGKIIQFGDVRMKHLRLLYVRLWLILSPLLLTVEQVAQCDKRRVLAMRGIGRSSPSSDRWFFFFSSSLFFLFLSRN